MLELGYMQYNNYMSRLLFLPHSPYTLSTLCSWIIHCDGPMLTFRELKIAGEMEIRIC